ncbi:MAG: thioesterase family protein [Thermodesulfobacteriota bacterium]|nr:thioesterase family protein [Thermodesulfobacteriota bacterium]
MHRFDQDIAIEKLGENDFQSEITPNWSVNNNPDGGYLMAMMANAVLQESEKSWAAIFTANFIARCTPGKAELSVERLGQSKTFDRWQVGLSQDGQAKVQAFCTLTDPVDGNGEKRYETVPPELPPFTECFEFPQLPGYTIYSSMDVRLDPAHTGWLTNGNLADRSDMRGWIRFRDDRPFDMLSALLAADAFPPPALVSQGMVAWVPTIEMSVNIRNLPQSPWLKCCFSSRFINNGIVEEDGQIWDETNELVAISRQISQFRKTV